MTGLNINRNISYAPIESTSLRLVRFFSLPLLVYRLSSNYFIDSEFIYKSIPIQFPRTTHKGRVLYGASAYKRREIWRETHTPLWLLIGRIIFLTREKTSFLRFWLGVAVFVFCFSFSPVKNIFRSWLATTHLCMKIYVIAFQWVYFSNYLKNSYSDPEYGQTNVPFIQLASFTYQYIALH